MYIDIFNNIEQYAPHGKWTRKSLAFVSLTMVILYVTHSYKIYVNLCMYFVLCAHITSTMAHNTVKIWVIYKRNY